MEDTLLCSGENLNEKCSVMNFVCNDLQQQQQQHHHKMHRIRMQENQC